MKQEVSHQRNEARVRDTTSSSAPRWPLLPWSLATLLALIAPWLLGGRAYNAHLWLGSLAWLTVLAALLPPLLTWREWRMFAEYESRRGRASPNPLKIFRDGLLQATPLLLFIAYLGIAGANSMYAYADGELVQKGFISWLPAIIDPPRSRPAIFFFTGLVGMLVLLTNPTNQIPRMWLRRMLGLILLNAVILAWLGLWFRLTGSELILGHFEPVSSYFFASFTYKNHWAAFALLACGIGAFFLLRDLPRWLQDSRRAGTGGLGLLAIILFGLTLPIVESRSGILLFALFVVALVLLLFRQLKAAVGRMLMIGGSMIVVATLAYLSIADLKYAVWRTGNQMEKAESTAIIDPIRMVHGPRVCLDMIRDKPMLGWGYQSFASLFPVYATDYFRDGEGDVNLYMEFAHNDWLQHFLEFGLLGTMFLIVGIRRYCFMDGGRPNPELVPVYASFVLLGLFALWDFPLSNPAVLVTVVFLFTASVAYRNFYNYKDLNG